MSTKVGVGVGGSSKVSNHRNDIYPSVSYCRFWPSSRERSRTEKVKIIRTPGVPRWALGVRRGMMWALLQSVFACGPQGQRGVIGRALIAGVWAGERMIVSSEQ